MIILRTNDEAKLFQVVDHFKEELKEGDREAALDSLVRCKNQVSFHDPSPKLPCCFYIHI